MLKTRPIFWIPERNDWMSLIVKVLDEPKIRVFPDLIFSTFG